VVVEDVPGDEDEVHAKSGGALTQLLERRETSLPDPVAGVLLEPRNPQAKVKVRGVKEADHSDDLSEVWSAADEINDPTKS
jgi:hypothetical protein